MSMQNYTIPFANTGDTEEFSIDTDPSGKVSLEKGWTELYQLRPEEGGLFILRRVFNQMMKLVSTDTVTWKTQTFPNWIDDKGDGLPYSYDKDTIIRYTDGLYYVSLVASNTEEPTTGSNWQEFTAYLQSFGTEIATAGDIRTGINNTKAISPLGYNATTLGWGQTWQNVTSSRSIRVTYTNNTGKPIFIEVGAGGQSEQYFLIDGVKVGYIIAMGDVDISISAIVPEGSTYSFASDGVGNIVRWSELR